MKGRALPHGAAGLDREAPRAGVGPVCIQAPVSSSVKRGELHLPVTIREYVSVQSFLADLQCVSCTMLGVGDTVMQALPCWGLWPRPDSNQGRLLGGRDTTLKSSTPGTGPGRHPREPRVASGGWGGRAGSCAFSNPPAPVLPAFSGPFPWYSCSPRGSFIPSCVLSSPWLTCQPQSASFSLHPILFLSRTQGRAFSVFLYTVRSAGA